MSRWSNTNPITHQYNYSQCQHTQQRPMTTNSKFKRVVDGVPHTCADGHKHATVYEVEQCIAAHQVYVCASNHMHTKNCDAERCDQIKREEDCFKDKELQRQHDREMMDKQIRLSENLKRMNWDFKRMGTCVPRLEWTD